MNRWRAVVGVIAIFLLGAITGVTGTGLVIRHRVETLHRQGPPPVKPLVMHRINRHLNLTEKQQVVVETALNQFQNQLTLLRQTYKPEARRLLDECFERIGRELNPEQKTELERIREHLPWQFSRRHGPGRHQMRKSCPGMPLDHEINSFPDG